MSWITNSSKYELVGKVGEEGVGTVHKAIESGTERIFAVKVFHKAKSLQEERRRRVAVKRQMQILASVRNQPHILNIGVVRYMNESRRKVELPMDFYAHDLFWLMREAINERAAGVYQRWIWFPDWYHTLITQMLQALHFLHTQNIVHRGVHPLKIVYNTTDHFVLGDFGDARCLSEEVVVDPSCEPKYVAPEMYFDAPQTTAVDIWSLGVLSLDILNIVPAIHASSSLEALERLNFCADMNELATELDYFEVVQMLQIGLTERPTAGELLKSSKTSPLKGVRRVVPSSKLLAVAIKKNLRNSLNVHAAGPFSERQSDLVVTAYIKLWGPFPSRTEPDTEYDPGRDLPSSDEARKAMSQAAALASSLVMSVPPTLHERETISSAAAGQATGSREQETLLIGTTRSATTSSELEGPSRPDATRSQGKARKKKRKSLAKAASPASEPQGLRESSSAGGMEPAKLQDEGATSRAASESSTMSQDLKMPSSLTTTPPTKLKDTGEDPKAETGGLSSAAAWSSTGPQERKEDSSAAAMLRSQSLAIGVSSNPTTASLRTKSEEIGRMMAPLVGLKMIPKFAGTSSPNATQKSTELRQTEAPLKISGVQNISQSEVLLSTDVTELEGEGRQSSETLRKKKAASGSLSKDNPWGGNAQNPSSGSDATTSQKEGEKPSIAGAGQPSSSTSTSLSTNAQRRDNLASTFQEEKASRTSVIPCPSESQGGRKLSSTGAQETSSDTRAIPNPKSTQKTEKSSTPLVVRPSGSAVTTTPAETRRRVETPIAVVSEKSLNKAATSVPTLSQRTDRPSVAAARENSLSPHKTPPSVRAARQEKPASEGISEKLLRIPAMERPTSSASIARSASQASTDIYISSGPTSPLGRAGSSSSTPRHGPPAPSPRAGSGSGPRRRTPAKAQEVKGPPRSISKSNLGPGTSKSGPHESPPTRREAKSSRPAGLSAPAKSKPAPTAPGNGGHGQPSRSLPSASSHTDGSQSEHSDRLGRKLSLSKALSADAPPWDGVANKWGKSADEGTPSPECPDPQQVVQARSPPTPEQVPQRLLYPQAHTPPHAPQVAQARSLPTRQVPRRVRYPQDPTPPQALRTAPYGQIPPQGLVYAQHPSPLLLSPHMQARGYVQHPNPLLLPPYTQSHGYSQHPDPLLLPPDMQARGYSQAPMLPMPQLGLSPTAYSPPQNTGTYSSYARGSKSAQSPSARQHSRQRAQNQISKGPAGQASKRYAEGQSRQHQAQEEQQQLVPAPSASPSSSLPATPTPPGGSPTTKRSPPPANAQRIVEGKGHGRLPRRPSESPGPLGLSRVQQHPGIETLGTDVIVPARYKDRVLHPSSLSPSRQQADTPPVQPEDDQRSSPNIRPLRDGSETQAALSQAIARPAPPPAPPAPLAPSQPPQASSSQSTLPFPLPKSQGQGQGQSGGTPSPAAANSTRPAQRQNQEGGGGGGAWGVRRGSHAGSMARSIGDDSAAAALGRPLDRDEAGARAGQRRQEVEVVEGRKEEEKEKEGNEGKVEKEEEQWQLPKNTPRRQRSRAKMGSYNSLVGMGQR